MFKKKRERACSRSWKEWMDGWVGRRKDRKSREREREEPLPTDGRPSNLVATRICLSRRRAPKRSFFFLFLCSSASHKERTAACTTQVFMVSTSKLSQCVRS